MTCENNHIHICNCPFDCDNHGTCCACLYHHVTKGEFPSCFFKSEKAIENRDRSLDVLLKERKAEVMQILKKKNIKN